MKTEKEYKSTYYSKLKADPIRYAKYLKKCRQNRKDTYHKDIELSRTRDREKYKENRVHIIKRSYKDKVKYQKNNKIKLTFYRYASSARKRNLDFELSREHFNSLLVLNCTYCGDSKNIGVDRVDNSIGYTINNSVPCCSICNYMKKDHSLEVFIKHCNLIAEFTKK